MASVNVSNGATGSPDKTTNLSPPDPGEEESLTQLIESELALRIAAAHGPPPPDELLVQADFFSTTQYESPSDEVPPQGDPFDPFSTTVEQSPTFTGFSTDELKDFDQDPFCAVLSPTIQPLIKASIKDSIIGTNVDLLSDLVDPSPESVKKLKADLELSFEPDLVSSKDQDPINQTIDLSPTPPPDSKTKLLFNDDFLSPSDEKIIDLSPTEDEELLQQPDIEITEPEMEQNGFEIEPISEEPDLSVNEPVNEPISGENGPDLPEIETISGENEPDLSVNEPELAEMEPDLLENEPVSRENEPISGENEPDLGEVEEMLGENEEILEENGEVLSEQPDLINETKESIYEDIPPSPIAVQEIVNSGEIIIPDPIYQTYDLSPSPPIENGASNVEIVISEPTTGGDVFAPMSLEIDGFETWTVAGTEEEEEEAPPLQKSLLPERPTTLPHVTDHDETNNVVDAGEEVISPSSEEPSTPSAESSPTKKKASKKTKSSGEGKTKKSKKTKKCEEKENISVAGLPPPDLLHEIRSLRSTADPEPITEQDAPVKSLASPITLVSREELGNVSVKNLSMKFVRGPKATQLRTDMDELEGVSLRALREMYITEASKSFNGHTDKQRPNTETVAVSINSLRRSFGDLSTLTDAETNGDRSISPGSIDAPISPMFRKAYGTLPLPPKSPKHPLNLGKNSTDESCKSPVCDVRARSYSDLTVRENNNNKEPIITGVSVKALLASYCSIAQLNEVHQTIKRSTKKSSIPTIQSHQSRSSFSKFDALSRKSGVLHVRSSDAAKAQQHFSQGGGAGDPSAPQHCRACGTQVFQMEQVKAEKSVWHKNCFRCKECNKQLTVDSYSSNEGVLYCKPHFKDLFKPKAVAIEEPALLRPRRLEMIIRENQPEELPPDVVRASDKPDLGLEELTSLNVKSRYQAFERTEDSTNEIDRSSSNVNVKRSPSILSKLAKFQAKGMDVGVTDEALNGIPVETSSEEEEEESEDDQEDGEDKVVKARVKKERPMSFGKMDDVRSMWATGQAQRREEQREERKEEVQKLRSRLFMGKCVKVKEMYEQAVQESAGTKTSSQQRASEVRSNMAQSIKERFEKGETLLSDSEDAEDQDNKKNRHEDLSVFEAGISKKSRSMFLELDSAAKSQQQSPHTPRSPISKPEPRRAAKEWLSREASQEVVRASDKQEEVEIQTVDISNRFKFFEGYREPEKQRKKFRITPPRDGQVKESSPDRPLYRDPDVVRAEDHVAEEELVRSQTASRMLNLFRQMEENAGKEEVPEGPKPLKRFTPPPDYKKGDSGASSEEEEDSEEESGEEEESDDENRQSDVIRATDRMEDDFLKQAQSANAARAKALKAKFEQWDSSPVNGQRRRHENGQDEEEDEEEEEEKEGRESLETTSSLRARFESMGAPAQAQGTLNRDRPKVNRFV